MVAGGNTDILGRIVAPKLAERLVKAYQDKSLLDNPTGVAKVIHEAAEETNEILKENKLYCGK